MKKILFPLAFLISVIISSCNVPPKNGDLFNGTESKYWKTIGHVFVQDSIFSLSGKDS